MTARRTARWCLALAALALLPAPAAMAAPATPEATGAAAETVVQGSEAVEDAPVLTPGAYRDVITPGQRRFWAVQAPAGQVPAVALAVDGLPEAPLPGGVLHLGIVDEGQRLIEDAYTTAEFPGTERRTLRAVVPSPAAGGQAATYYVGLALEAGGQPAEAGQSYVVHLNLATVEIPGVSPPPASEGEPERTEPAASAPSRQPPSGGTRAGGDGSSPPLLPVSVLAFLAGAALGFARIRILRRPLAPSRWRDRTRRWWVRVRAPSSSL
jgi:hypothetical protein